VERIDKDSPLDRLRRVFRCRYGSVMPEGMLVIEMNVDILRKLYD
jgi:hypothetical protein